MSQTGLFLSMHLLGLAVCLAVGPRRVPALSCALAFPLGLAVAVLLALAILLSGVPYGPWTLGAAMAATGTAAAIVAVRRGTDRRDLLVACWWTVVFAIACLGLTYFNVALYTIDSHRLLSLAVAISNDGGLAPETMAQLDKQGVFQIVAHSMAGLTLRDFLYALPLVLGVTFIPMFALALWHGLGAAGAAARRRWMPVALVTAAVFTMSMVDYHMLYIHTNLGAAVYLFGYLVLFWIAEVESDASWLPLAFISLLAFALQRTETPLVALLFVALTVTQSELPRRVLTVWLAVFTFVVAIWYESLAHHVSSRGFVTPTRSRLVAALLVGFLLWWLASRNRVVRRLNRLMPAAVAGACAVALAAAFAARPDHMARSTMNWASNLIDLPLWGHSWFVIPALVLLGLAAEPPRFRQAFAVGLPVYVAAVLLLSFALRNPYRLGLGDSANRMTIHLVPLIFYYLAIKLIPALLRPEVPEDQQHGPVSSASGPPGLPTTRQEDPQLGR